MENQTSSSQIEINPSDTVAILEKSVNPMGGTVLFKFHNREYSLFVENEYETAPTSDNPDWVGDYYRREYTLDNFDKKYLEKYILANSAAWEEINE